MVKDMYKKVTHVIFDMDGLLLNTEDLYTKAFQTVCSRYGKDYSWSIKQNIMGMKADLSAKYVIDKLSLPHSVEEFKKETFMEQQKVFPHSELLPGAEKLVRHLKQHNIPIAICSGSSRAAFTLKTSHLADFFQVFDPVVLCGDDPEVKKGKPFPDSFQVTQRRFKTKPAAEEVLVFEDSPNGVEAAIAADMQVVMVPDPRISDDKKERATLSLESLEKFRPEQFGLPAYPE